LFSNNHTIASIVILILSTLMYLATSEFISGVLYKADIGKTFEWNYGVWCYYLIVYCLLGLTSMMDLALTRWV
jgi:F0F1-type ATP synthase assembly protein I